MAWSVPIWKIYGFPKDSRYLERFVLKHATAHIHKRYPPLEKSPPHIYTHLVFANSQALPKKSKEYKFSHRTKTVNKFGE